MATALLKKTDAAIANLKRKRKPDGGVIKYQEFHEELEGKDRETLIVVIAVGDVDEQDNDQSMQFHDDLQMSSG